MSDRNFDSLAYSLARYAEVRPAMSFRARSRAAALNWQRELRQRLIARMGGFPPKPCPLRAQVTERREFAGYARETVVFNTRPGLSMYAYFLLPRGAVTPAPAVLCCPGHGRGVDDIVGIDEKGAQRAKHGGYQADFAVQCAQQGYATLAIEQLGFGHRRDAAARGRGDGASSCQPASGAALLLGETMIGWRVYDAMRSLDYLATRPEVDAGRLAIMGISGGGTTGLHAACVDERIKAAVVSGYFCTFGDSIFSIQHCMDNYVPGVLRDAEMYDLAGLIAPRALFVESGTKDNIFPVRAVRRAVSGARQIYAVFGRPEAVGCQIFRGPHEFHGKEAFRFLRRML